MTGTALVVVDVTQVFRDWLRTQNIGGVIGTRVWAGGLPNTAADAELPAIALHRITSAVRAPIEIVTYQFDCYAPKASEAAAVAAALTTLLLSTGGDTTLGVSAGHAVRYGGTDEESITNSYVADPEIPSDVHRHRVDAQTVFIPRP